MKYRGHLVLEDAEVAPSMEWEPPVGVWCYTRVGEGQGYWMGRPETREVNTGDVLVLSPSRVGTLRASRLGPMRLSVFRFCPDSMGGLLMMSERHFFEHQGALVRRAFRLFPATHAVGRAFQELCERTEAANGFLARCRMLHLIALVFDHELSRAGAGEGVILSADRRINELMQRLTEDEFIRASSEELAGHCGCSVRHFSRLFRRHFGVSLRMWQTELRLLKARRMLAETNFKVINVASACGYRHLGLFNGLFKRRFSMTPTEWRRQAGRNGHADSVGLVTEK